MNSRQILLVIVANLVAIGSGHAESSADPPAFQDFTFKRVRPPAPGEKNRINIQVDPAAPVVRLPAKQPDAPDARATMAWFWDSVSPELGAGGPGRLQQALELLETVPVDQGPSAPALSTLRKIADTHAREILLASVGTRVSPALVVAVIGVESAGRPIAVSPKGAAGLMQLMPATAARFDVTDSTDPAQNIRGGVAYLDWLLKEFGGDPVLALAAYNAGEGSLRDHGGVPPYAETRAYVPKVLAAWRVARLLCATPPELISDGCVFALDAKG